jgi:hypothetical protein
MNDWQPPKWASDLRDEDFAFIKRFVLASGSLKEIAESYKVSYPTVRLKLDRLIQKITLSESERDDMYVAFIKNMALDQKISVEAAKLLINMYKKETK